MIEYLLEVALFQTAAVSVYRLLWYKYHRPGWNRAILLTLVCVSFMIPLLSFETSVSHELPLAPEAWVGNQMEQLATYVRTSPLTETGISTLSIVSWIYSLVAGLLLLRYIFSLTKLIYNQQDQRLTRYGKVYSTSYPFAYSFFGRIHVPDQLETHDDLETIMLHEQQHAYLGHSWDRLLMGLVSVLLWFNPFTHLLKKYLIEIHEFEADQRTIAITRQPLQYQWLLLEQSSYQKQRDLINHFAFSNTKRRLQMINTRKTKAWRYLLIVPVLGTLSGLFAFEQKTQNILPLTRLSTASLLPDESVENQASREANETPSILPLKVARDAVRVSSHWGERKDPYTKEMKHHFGMDIVAALGTPVIATADGTVIEVGSKPNGYGNYVVVQHGELFKTRYAQMKDAIVKEGDRVNRGQTVGHLGNSGRSTAPHLHYEVIKNGKRVNPSSYIQDFKAE